MMNNRRVVVTGLGVVSSVGIGKERFWESIINGRSGISRVESFDTSKLRCHYAGEIKDFRADEFIPRRLIPFLGRTSQFAISASILALKDARLRQKDLEKKRAGVFIGTTMGERPMEESIDKWVKEGVERIDKQMVLQATANNISTNVANYFRIQGPNYLIPTACAAGNYAIGYAFDLIKKGDIDYAIAGGGESFSKLAFSGFHRLYAMAPERCQPFDKNRKGMILGEGAGILILESLESALSRGVRIYAEILGYGLSCDAYHITTGHVEGIQKVIKKAMEDAGIDADDIDYISAHGTGTPGNDRVECSAIKKVLGERYKGIPISSIKSMIGHTMGAASAIEALTCCLVVSEDIIPPTINFETPDPYCDIDCVPNKARIKNVRVVLNNAFAFGGNNSCLVIKKYDSR
jgi:3-oxoacyl-[acyl-carrier-protein] synthase II